MTGTSASGCRAGGFSTAPVCTLNFDPWQGQPPLAATVQPWWVQIAVWATTEPLVAASSSGPDGPSTTTDPADSTSATDATALPAGVDSAADDDAADDDAAVEDSAAEDDSVDDPAADDDAVVPAAEADAEEPADELPGAEVAAGLELFVVAEFEPQAAAAARTAVPEAARMVRRGNVRGSGVTGGSSGWLRSSRRHRRDGPGRTCGHFHSDTRRPTPRRFDATAGVYVFVIPGCASDRLHSSFRRAGHTESDQARTFPVMHSGRMKLMILAGCLAGVTATAVAGGLATDPDGPYYRALEKPSWQPPPPVYGIVWTPLYADIALSAGHAIARLGDEQRVREQRSLIAALGINLALNAGWSWLFFRFHRPWVAAAECAVLTASSADLVRRVGAADRRAGIALAPYPAWCGFATALTVAIARRNPLSAIRKRLR